MGRAPCCDKANVKKGPWSPEEDAKLKSYIEQHGTGGNWIALPQKIGLKRCGKSCRLRWLNYLRPNIRHGGFSEEEDNIICSLYLTIGSRWSIIAAQLPGRTDNDIKNYWNTRLKKKLLGKQRKEKHARKSSCLKQEMMLREGTHENSMVAENSNQSTPYWPDLPVLASVPYSSQEPCFNDIASIRKLLIKLGGRFSDGDHDDQLNVRDGMTSPYQLQGLDVSPSQPAVNALSHAPLHVLNTAASQVANPHDYDVEGAVLHMLSGQSIFQAEFEEMVCNYKPQIMNGMEFLHEDMVSNRTESSGCGESSNWGGMSSRVFPSNYGGDLHLQQVMPQECPFDELRYTGEI